MPEIVGFLRHVQLFAGATGSALGWLRQQLSEVWFEPGEVVFAEGQPGNAVGFLVSGRLAVGAAQGQGVSVQVGAIYPNEFFGEMACIDPGPRTATVTATSKSRVMFMSSEVLELINDSHPALGVSIRQEILRLLAARLREVDARAEVVFDQGTIVGDPPPESPGPEHLRAVEMLRSFSDAELQALYRVARPIRYDVGHVLAHQGAPAEACYLVLRGAVDVMRMLSGEKRRLARLDAGAMVGIVGMVDGADRSASIVVAEPAAIMTFARADFQRLLAAQSPFAVRFQIEIARSAVGQLRAANRRLARLETR